MRSFWIPVVTAFMIQCTVLVLTSPLAVTSPTVEYLDVVFDEASTTSSIDENIGTTEVPDELSLSDDVPHTTFSPCGNDFEIGSDCNPAANSIEVLSDVNIVKTDEVNSTSEKEEGTTTSPKET
jgi:hypothetical protein